MPTPIIEVRNLSKRYHLGLINRQTLQEEVLFWLHRLRGRNPAEHMGSLEASANTSEGRPAFHDEFWALRDISFPVERGEVLGILGRNGSGKSTLLKILSRITEPTGGEVVLRGRSASLLEVGTGFHPELTGRENIYLNGAILGMKRREIDARFDAIVDFSGVEKFLDTPVKRYSSGMYVRLAFAIAAHREPDILIVDEVLAVGDAEFQRKCMDRMFNVAQQGCTVLLVSHNMASLQSLCTRGLLLDRGRIASEGSIAQCIRHYHDLTSQPDPSDAVTTRGVPVSSLRVRTAPSGPVTAESALFAELEVFTDRRLTACTWNFVIEDMDGRFVIHTRPGPGEDLGALEPGWHSIEVHLPRVGIRMGVYSAWFRLVVDQSADPLIVDSSHLSLEITEPRVAGLSVAPCRWRVRGGRRSDLTGVTHQEASNASGDPS